MIIAEIAPTSNLIVSTVAGIIQREIRESGVISFARFARDREDMIVFACNFTPVPRTGYRLGVPKLGLYREILNTDSEIFGGSNMGNAGAVMAEDIPHHGRPASLKLTLPPLAVVAFKL